MPIQNTLPTAQTSDGGSTTIASRANSYQELFVAGVSNKELFTAVEGSHFVASTPTPGTGIVGHAAPTTFDETKPYLILYNGHPSKYLYPQFLHLHETVASGGGTRVQVTVCTDIGVRRTSAGTAMTLNNTNTNGSADGTSQGWIGAVIAAAATASRKIMANVVFRGTIDIVEDDYQIVWGAPDGIGNSSSRVATVAEVSRVVPPMAIGPGSSLLLHQWAGSQSTGPTFEAYMGYILR